MNIQVFGRIQNLAQNSIYAEILQRKAS